MGQGRCNAHPRHHCPSGCPQTFWKHNCHPKTWLGPTLNVSKTTDTTDYRTPLLMQKKGSSSHRKVSYTEPTAGSWNFSLSRVSARHEDKLQLCLCHSERRGVPEIPSKSHGLYTLGNREGKWNKMLGEEQVENRKGNAGACLRHGL